MRPKLIILGGLPGVGKTSIARELARQTGATHLRIDSIEQAIRSYGAEDAVRNGVGYSVAYALAEDNLRAGHLVIADSVNALQVTRDAWVKVARRAEVRAIEVEITCSDPKEHRRRVESRMAEIAGLRVPTWDDVVNREYDAWNREHLVMDTASQTLAQNVQLLQEVVTSG